MGLIKQSARLSFLRFKWYCWNFRSTWPLQFYITIWLCFWKSWTSWFRKNKRKD